MEREYYIDHIQSENSLYHKVEELAVTADLPITFDGKNLKYGLTLMKRDQDTYYYQNGNKSVFIFLNDARVKLAIFDDGTAEIYDVDLEHDNNLKYYSYANEELLSININHAHVSMSASNNVTKEFKDTISNLGVKMRPCRNKKANYYSFELSLPKLIDDEHRIHDQLLYIPASQATIITNNNGASYKARKNVFSMTYAQDYFKISPSIFASEILDHFTISKMEKGREEHITNPINLDNLKTILSPIRHGEIKNLFEKIIYNPHKGNLTTYLYRYYDELLHAIHYYQNDNKELFYVFEDDLKRLQLK